MKPPTRNGLKQSPLKKVSDKTRARNTVWKAGVIARAIYLLTKYGRVVCEYSGETIRIEDLTPVPTSPEQAWGHHIDGNRNNSSPKNCYIVKYRYHRHIEDNNIQVSQEDFQGACEPPQPVVRELD